MAGTDYENPLTFSNGLTRTTNTVKLGGNLDTATTITTNSVGSLDFTINGSGVTNLGTGTGAVNT